MVHESMAWNRHQVSKQVQASIKWYRYGLSGTGLNYVVQASIKWYRY